MKRKSRGVLEIERLKTFAPAFLAPSLSLTLLTHSSMLFSVVGAATSTRATGGVKVFAVSHQENGGKVRTLQGEFKSISETATSHKSHYCARSLSQ